MNAARRRFHEHSILRERTGKPCRDRHPDIPPENSRHKLAVFMSITAMGCMARRYDWGSIPAKKMIINNNFTGRNLVNDRRPIPLEISAVTISGFWLGKSAMQGKSWTLLVNQEPDIFVEKISNWSNLVHYIRTGKNILDKISTSRSHAAHIFTG